MNALGTGTSTEIKYYADFEAYKKVVIQAQTSNAGWYKRLFRTWTNDIFPTLKTSQREAPNNSEGSGSDDNVTDLLNRMTVAAQTSKPYHSSDSELNTDPRESHLHSLPVDNQFHTPSQAAGMVQVPQHAMRNSDLSSESESAPQPQPRPRPRPIAACLSARDELQIPSEFDGLPDLLLVTDNNAPSGNANSLTSANPIPAPKPRRKTTTKKAVAGPLKVPASDPVGGRALRSKTKDVKR